MIQNKEETFNVKGEKLLGKVKSLIREGNVRRIIIKDKKGKVLVEFPLTFGVVGAVLAPMLAAIGAKMAAARPTTRRAAPALLSSLFLPQMLILKNQSAKIAISPDSTTTTEDMRISLFPIWDSSWAITPSSSFLLSLANAPSVTATAECLGFRPVAKAFICWPGIM